MSDDTKIHFLFDKSNLKKRLKWKDIKLLQKVRNREADPVEYLERLQTIACRFMVDEKEQYVPFELAFEIFDDLSQEEAEDVIMKFAEAMADTAIPKANGTELTYSSPASSPRMETPPGGSPL